MKVWVVEPTAYGLYGIGGVYDSLATAKASRPDVTAWVERHDGWMTSGDAAVDSDGARIYETEVQTLDSLRGPIVKGGKK